MEGWQWVDLKDADGFVARGFMLDGRREGLWLESYRKATRVMLYRMGIPVLELGALVDAGG